MEESLMLEEILQLLKEIKEDVQRLSKGKSESNSLAEATAVPHCSIHDIDMKPRVSKTDGHTYFDHRSENNGAWRKCMGKGWLPS